MRRYSTYKDSGVSWIGEIPEHWEVKHLRSYIKLVSIKGYGHKKLLSVTREQGVIERNVDSKEENHNFIPDDLNGYKLVREGQFVINKMKSWQGSYGVSKYEGVVSPAYYVCNLKFLCKDFFSIAIRSKLYVPFFFQYSKGIRVDQWDLSLIALKSIPFIEPPVNERQTIVEFLNKKTSEIDNFIAKQEKQIELLKEWKQAEVTRVVTKGLNPEVKMKNSGISWIGEIPEHWKMRKIKYVFTERSEKGYPEEPVLCSTQKYGVIPQSLYENRVVVVNKGLEGLKLVKEGDFVISLRSFQGGIEYAYYRGIISAAYTILKLNNTLNEGYIKYLVKSFYFVELLKTCVTGIREGKNINYSSLRKHSIPIPPPSEQQEIVEYIERKTTEVDKLIVELTYQVEYLKEYKQRLISDVVTGKINVQPE